MALQRLFLGVNAHINYDLVLTLIDLLRDEWSHLDEHGIAHRLSDHRKVNEIIANTIDEVQDTILEREAPALDLIDKGLGRLDEMLIAKLITAWRDRVWEQAVYLLDREGGADHLDDIITTPALARAEAMASPRWYLHPSRLI